MKTALAWLLLLLIAIQWISGRPGYRVLYAVEVKRQMNAIEHAIAQALLEETGFEVHVKVLDRSELSIDGIRYTNDLLFSKELEGKRVLFQVNYSSLELSNDEFYMEHPVVPEGQWPNILNLDRLFSDFTICKTALLINYSCPLAQERVFAYHGLFDCLHLRILTPPPEKA